MAAPSMSGEALQLLPTPSLWGQSNSTVVRVLLLQLADPGSITGTPYDTPNSLERVGVLNTKSGVSPEHKNQKLKQSKDQQQLAIPETCRMDFRKQM